VRLASYQQRGEAEMAERRTIKRRLQHGYIELGVLGHGQPLAK
jgi:hypothetical protein